MVLIIINAVFCNAICEYFFQDSLMNTKYSEQHFFEMDIYVILDMSILLVLINSMHFC